MILVVLVILVTQLNCRQKLTFCVRNCKFCSKVLNLTILDRKVTILAKFVTFGYFKDLVMSTELSTKVERFVKFC